MRIDLSTDKSSSQNRGKSCDFTSLNEEIVTRAKNPDSHRFSERISQSRQGRRAFAKEEKSRKKVNEHVVLDKSSL